MVIQASTSFQRGTASTASGTSHREYCGLHTLFLLTNKVWSPQYSLWLVPLAVLAVPRWKLVLAWMTIDALVWMPRMAFYLGVDPNNAKKGLPADWFLGFVMVRDVAVIGLCALVIYEI